MDFSSWTAIDAFETAAYAAAGVVIVGILGEGAEYLLKIIDLKGFRDFVIKEGSDNWMSFLDWLAKCVKPKHVQIEGIAFALIVIGLAVELLAGKASRLQSAENAQLIYRSSVIESNNLALQIKLQPRIISEQQITNFIFLTQYMGRIPIGIGVTEARDEVFNYAIQLRKMFSRAGFPIPNSDTNFPRGIRPFLGRVVEYPYLGQGDNRWVDFDFVYNTTNDLTTYSGYKFFFQNTNGWNRPIVPIFGPDDPYRDMSGLCLCFKQIGFTNFGTACQTDMVSENQFYILVLPKSE